MDAVLGMSYVEECPNHEVRHGEDSRLKSLGRHCWDILDDALKGVGLLQTLSRVPVVHIVFVSVHHEDRLYREFVYKLGLTDSDGDQNFDEHIGTFVVDSSGFTHLNSSEDVHDLILAKQIVANVKEKIPVQNIHLNGVKDFQGIPLSLIKEMASGETNASKSYVQIKLMHLDYKQVESNWPCILFTKNSLVVLPIDCEQFHSEPETTFERIQTILSSVKTHSKEGRRVIFTSIQSQGVPLDKFIMMAQELDHHYGLLASEPTSKRPFANMLVEHSRSQQPLFVVKESQHGLLMDEVYAEVARQLCEQKTFTSHYPVSAVVAAKLLRYCNANVICTNMSSSFYLLL